MNNQAPVRPGVHRHVERHNYSINICLLYAELEYDVKHMLWKRGQMASDKGEPVRTFAVTSDDTDWMMRTFDEAVKNLKARLKPYVVDNSQIASDEILEEETPEYNIVMVMDDGWTGSADNLCNDAHQYVVNYAITEWLTIDSDTLAGTYATKADQAIRSAYDEANSYDLEETPVFRF